MREMKDSGVGWIGQIPKNWRIARLKHIKANKKYAIVDGPFGSAINTTDYKDFGVPLIRITNLVNGEISNESLVFISKEHAEKISRSAFSLNDLIVAKTGATVGKCSINTSIEYGILSSSCVKISIDNKHESKYYYYLMTTNEFRDELIISCGGTTRDTINLLPFSNLKIVVPNYFKQRAIVEYLDEKVTYIDNIIEKTKESIEEYKKLKQSIITETVTKGLNPDVKMKDSGIEWIGEIPEHWGIKKLKYLTDLNQKTLSETTEDEYEFEYVDIGSVTLENGIEYSEIMKFSDSPSRARRIAKAGDIVISTVRTYLRAISPIEKDLIVSTGFAVLTPKDVYHKFLEYIVKSEPVIGYISANSYGISYPAINSSQIMEAKVIVPSYEEQIKIAEFIQKRTFSIDKLLNDKKTIISELESYKKSLIYEVVTGKKEIPTQEVGTLGL